MNIVRVLLCMCLCLLASCALEPSYRAQQVKPAYPAMVTSCTFLGGVTGGSDIPFIAYGEQAARYQALDAAAQLGATHIVWTDLKQGTKALAIGRAYRCEE
jgi:hypothetical protein